MTQTKILLDESEIPTHWYNIAADMPNPPAPPLGPDGKPIGPDALTAIFPMSLIEQEMSALQPLRPRPFRHGRLRQLLQRQAGRFRATGSSHQSRARAVASDRLIGIPCGGQPGRHDQRMKNIDAEDLICCADYTDSSRNCSTASSSRLSAACDKARRELRGCSAAECGAVRPS